MRTRIIITLTILSITIVGNRSRLFAEDYGRRDVEAVDTALVQVIANPKQSNNSHVRICGVYYYDNEGSYLFLTKEHYEAYDTASAVALPVDAKYLPIAADEARRLNGRLVMIEGVFHAKDLIAGESYVTPIARIMTRDKGKKNDTATQR